LNQYRVTKVKGTEIVLSLFLRLIKRITSHASMN